MRHAFTTGRASLFSALAMIALAALSGCASLPPPTLAQQVFLEVRTMQPYHSAVDVRVVDGVAYLYGFTESLYDKNLMTLAARRVEGIEHVVNHVYTTH